MQWVKRFHYLHLNVCSLRLQFDLVGKQWMFGGFNFIRRPSKTEWCSSFIPTAFGTDKEGSACTSEKVEMAKQTTQAQACVYDFLAIIIPCDN